jgi:serine/threonine protein kinase
MNEEVGCPDVEMLRRLVMGQVGEAEAAPLVRHLASCPDCGERATLLQADDGLIRALRAGSPLLDGPDAPAVDRLITQFRGLGPDERDTVIPASGSAAGPEVYSFLALPRQADEIGRLGRYRVLKVLGRGGMGVVFLADDPQLKRPVALKVLLDAHYTDPRHAARLQGEAEAVARLHHPNIVQIYEVSNVSGRPYLALEYVEGGTLAQQIEGNPQPIHAVAELIATLARAVHHAHEQGIVHRDLKPANILLQEEHSRRGAEVQRPEEEQRRKQEAGAAAPVPSSFSSDLRASAPLREVFLFPKIADFGLAKRLDEEGLTQTGELLGTPRYMAPEQADGKVSAIGPPTDVYALGVILYELLTGRPPFRGESVLDTLEQVRSLDPVPPRRLRPPVARDLETICLKCLEKEPKRRYPTALELADDLERFLQDRPIRARPIGVLVRVHKWARRRPALAALLAVSVLALAALIGGGVVYERQLRAALAQAEANRDRAEAQQERADTNYREAREAIRRILGRARTRGRAGIPRLGELQREQQEEALAFFLAVARQPDNGSPEVRFDVALACEAAGQIQHRLSRLGPACSSYRRALDLATALARDFPTEPRYRALQAENLENLAACHLDRETIDEGERLHREALVLREQLIREQPASADYKDALSRSYNNLGTVASLRKRLEDAARCYRRAAALQEELVRDYPAERGYQLRLAQDQVSLLNILQQTPSASVEMEELQGPVRSSLTRLLKEDPQDLEALITFAVLRINWAYVLAERGKSKEALADLALSINALEEVLQQEPSHISARDRLLRSYGVRAHLLEKEKQFTEAVAAWKRVVELAPPKERKYQRLFLAMALVKAGDHAGAVAEAEALAAVLPANAASAHFQYLGEVCSLAATAVRALPGLSTPARDACIERYEVRAVEMLARAKSAAGTTKWRTLILRLLIARYCLTRPAVRAFIT